MPLAPDRGSTGSIDEDARGRDCGIFGRMFEIETMD